jgi:hypothetical protein
MQNEFACTEREETVDGAIAGGGFARDVRGEVIHLPWAGSSTFQARAHGRRTDGPVQGPPTGSAETSCPMKAALRGRGRATREAWTQ